MIDSDLSINYDRSMRYFADFGFGIVMLLCHFVETAFGLCQGMLRFR